MALFFTKRDKWRSGRWDDDTAAAWSMSETLDLFFLVYICAAHYNKELERKKERNLLILSHVMERQDGSWEDGRVGVLRDDSRKSRGWHIIQIDDDAWRYRIIFWRLI